MNTVKETLPQNLTRLRTERNMTQIEVAEKLNYTDKSVSKWERGEATPPIDVLKDLADLYEVSLDYLVTNVENDSYDKKYTSRTNKRNKIVITLLAVSLVWILATVMFTYGIIFIDEVLWILFVAAVPSTAVVLLIFNCIWGKRKFTFILISVLIWTALATVYLTFLTLAYNLWAIFTIGVPLQIATVLWSQLKKSS